MTRKVAIRIALVVTPLLAFILYAALNWYEIEEKTVRTGLGDAARSDRYLALTRLLQRMGVQAEMARAPTRLARPPEGGVLVMGGYRLAYMTPVRLRELEAWVRRGGTLVVQAEPLGIDDPLLERFGVDREVPPSRRGLKKRAAGEDEPAPPAPAEAAKRRPANFTATFNWPGAERPLRVRQFGSGLRLRGEAEPADLVTGSIDGKLLIAAFPVDRGRFVVLSDFSFMNNRAIAELDHAEFAWRLASAAPANRPAMLFLRVESPSLGEWLTEYAWPVLVGALLLILVWIARIGPRFGPLEPEAPPVRRSLLEHLRAAGRYVWSRGDATTLIDAVRDRVWRSALRRRGGLKSLAHSRAHALLAEIAGKPPATIERALHGAPANPAAFIATASALQEIEAGLAHRSRPSLRTKKEKQK